MGPTKITHYDVFMNEQNTENDCRLIHHHPHATLSYLQSITTTDQQQTFSPKLSIQLEFEEEGIVVSRVNTYSCI